MHELPQRHRITVEHFYRMAEVGVFAENDRVELIDGEIIDVPPMGHPRNRRRSSFARNNAPSPR